VANPDFYTVGGTVQAEDGIYLSRHADEELLALCLNRIFAYVLTPRQMGKSSLMIRTAEQLFEAGIRSVIIDLNEVGVDVSAEQWYLGILTLICEQLSLDLDVVDWWHSNNHLGRTQRLTQFFVDVLLKKISNSVVIFVDEIDTTLSLDFTDDFYAAVRSLYLNRARISDFHRISFVLIGVATPSDLISDKNRTPFNIGQRIDLTDFTLEEAMPLAEGLGLATAEAKDTLSLILNWTNGHPYLTQRLCQALAEENCDNWTHEEVAEVVDNIFLGEMSRSDDNLRSVRDLMLKRSPLLASTLITYREILNGNKAVQDEEQSLTKSHLKLSGIVKSIEGNLQVRNEIYREVFNLNWVNENLPVNWVKILRRTVYGLVATFFISLIPLSIYAEMQRRDAVDQREVAEDQKDEAESQRSIAEREAREAERQRQIAEEARGEAEQQRTEAEKQREEAIRQRQIAEEARGEAEEARLEEERQKQLAISREQEARELRQEAERLRLLAESERIVSQANLARARFAQSNEIEGLLLALKAKRDLGSFHATDIQLNQELERATASLQGAMSEMIYSVQLKNILESSNVGTFEKVEFIQGGELIKATDCESYQDFSGLWTLEVREVLWDLSGKKVQEIESQPRLGVQQRISDEERRLCPPRRLSSSNTNSQSNDTYTDSKIIGDKEMTVLIPEGDESRVKVLLSNTSESNKPNAFLDIDQDNEKVHEMKFVRQGEILALMQRNGSVILHDMTNQHDFYNFNSLYPGLASDIDFFPTDNNLTFLISLGRKMVFERDIVERLLPTTNYLRTKLALWDANSGKTKGIEISQLNADISSLTISPDGKLVALGVGTPAYKVNNYSENVFASSFDAGGIFLLNSDSFHKSGTVKGLMKKAGNITTIDFSPSGEYIAAGDSQGKVLLWNYNNNDIREFDLAKATNRKRRETPDIITGLSFNPSSTHLAVVDSSGSGKLWNFLDDEIIDLRNSGSFIGAGLPDNFFVTTNSQGDVKLWNWLGEEIGSFSTENSRGSRSSIASMTFSSEAGLIALGKREGSDRSNLQLLSEVGIWSTDLDSLATKICNWLADYLDSNINVTEEERQLCL
jgi:WD40 repeat protein/flagellar biosynthesis GTPase FlhF